MPHIEPISFDHLPRSSREEVRLLNALRHEFSNADLEAFKSAFESVSEKYLGESTEIAVDRLGARSEWRASDHLMAQFLIPKFGQRLLLVFSLIWAKRVVDHLLGGNGALSLSVAPLSALEQGVFEFFLLKLIQTLQRETPTAPYAHWEYEGLASDDSACFGDKALLELGLHVSHKTHSTRIAVLFDGTGLCHALSTQHGHEPLDAARCLALCGHLTSFYHVEVGKVWLDANDRQQLEEGDILLFDESAATLLEGRVCGDAKLRVALMPHWTFSARVDSPPDSPGHYRLHLNHFEEEHPHDR